MTPDLDELVQSLKENQPEEIESAIQVTLSECLVVSREITSYLNRLEQGDGRENREELSALNQQTAAEVETWQNLRVIYEGNFGQSCPQHRGNNYYYADLKKSPSGLLRCGYCQWQGFSGGIEELRRPLNSLRSVKDRYEELADSLRVDAKINGEVQ